LGLRRGRVHAALLLFSARGFGGALRFSFLAHLEALFLDDLLDTLTRVFARLCPRRREVAVLGAVQIRPGIQRCNVLGRIVRIGLRFGLRHRMPVQLPLLHDFPQYSPSQRRSYAELTVRKTEVRTWTPSVLIGNRSGDAVA